MVMSRTRIAIVAALEREVAPLVRGWTARSIEHDGRRYPLFENGTAAAICGGIGANNARRATEAVIREVNPTLVISVGFAGALEPSLEVGSVLQPSAVINVVDGVRTEIGSGERILVSSPSVAGKEQKARLAKTYGASAVDMEAGAVAQGAQARGIEFAALKAISDGADFDLPPVLDRFVTGDGRFQSAQFAFYVAVRPWLWGTTVALARNSSNASRALCEAIAEYLELSGANGHGSRDLNAGVETVRGSSLLVETNSSKSDSEFAGEHTGCRTEVHTQIDRN
jgi:adenosylhomocysteine nucleosidase